jgi:hypothetical protein
MIILSWDVGITHLAYCIMEGKYDNHGDNDKNQHDIKILDWDTIDLLQNDKTKQISCCGKLKPKRKNLMVKNCDKKAKYCQNLLTGETIGFCKTHLKQHETYWSVADTNALFTKLDKKTEFKCQYVSRTDEICGKNAHMGHGDKHYCNSHGKIILKNTIKELSPQLIKKTTVNDFSTSEIQFKLVTKLNKLLEHFTKLGVKGVIIENQPNKNGQMKSIACTLYDYFLIKCVIDKEMDINFVTYYSASNKLQIDKKNTEKVLKNVKNDKERYELTKGLGILYTRKFLENDNDDVNLKFLELYDEKKDDLCDSYLQGRYYLEKCHNFDTNMNPKKKPNKKRRSKPNRKVSSGSKKSGTSIGTRVGKKKVLEL